MYNPHDHYSQKAKRESYAARSVYKLMEINNRYNIIKQGQRILDLGCCPGSWTQYCLQQIKNNGIVVSIDLNPMEIKYKKLKTDPKTHIFIQADFSAKETKEMINAYKPFHVILSDMAPKTSGNRLTDTVRSMELVQNAYQFACDSLKNNGSFIAKVFQSQEERKLFEAAKKSFRFVKTYKPKATRKQSNEIYFIFQNYKQNN